MLGGMFEFVRGNIDSFGLVQLPPGFFTYKGDYFFDWGGYMGAGAENALVSVA